LTHQNFPFLQSVLQSVHYHRFHLPHKDQYNKITTTKRLKRAINEKDQSETEGMYWSVQNHSSHSIHLVTLLHDLPAVIRLLKCFLL
jgi:copper(I)-binding protein